MWKNLIKLGVIKISVTEVKFFWSPISSKHMGKRKICDLMKYMLHDTLSKGYQNGNRYVAWKWIIECSIVYFTNFCDPGS